MALVRTGACFAAQQRCKWCAAKTGLVRTSTGRNIRLAERSPGQGTLDAHVRHEAEHVAQLFERLSGGGLYFSIILAIELLGHQKVMSE